MISHNLSSTLSRTSISLACALAMLGPASSLAAPSQEWSLLLTSPDSQTLRMLAGDQPRMVADEFGGVRVLMLDGNGPTPTTLRSQAIAADGGLGEASRVVAEDYLPNGHAELNQRGDHYATSYSTIGGVMAKSWRSGDPAVQSALAFALSDAESIAALRVAENGDTIIARTVMGSSKRTSLLLERYTTGGKLGWSYNLGDRPAGAVALAEFDNGQIAVSYIANGMAFSARGGAVSSLISRLIGAAGREQMRQSIDLDRDYVASSAIISQSGDSYLAVKSAGKRSSTCAMLAHAHGTDQVNISFSVQAQSCTAPAQLSAADDGYAAIFVADLGSGNDALLVSGNVHGQEWIRAIGSDDQALERRQVVRLSDGSVAYAVAAPNLLRAVAGSMDLKVEWIGADGLQVESQLHPDLRHGDQFAISAAADGGYIVSYSSFDPAVFEAAVAVAKVQPGSYKE